MKTKFDFMIKSLRQLLISGLILIIIIATSCGTEVKEDFVLKIIETSDVHGAFFLVNYNSGRPMDHSLAHVHTYVNEEKQKEGQEVLLFDNGDILQGSPLVYYYNFEAPQKVHACARIMNYMGYDVATAGNHDIEPGHAVYDKIAAEFNFPWLAANAIKESNGKPYFKPYKIFRVKGVKIAVLGLITPAIPQWLPPAIWEGMRFEDMIVSAKYWSEEILKKESPDLLIGLFHAGSDYTYNGQDASTPFNENASVLVAEQVPGFDIVFVGHDHHGWNYTVKGPCGKEVHILGPASRARDVAVASISFSYNAENDTWNKTISGELVKMSEFEADSLFLHTFSDVEEEVKEYIEQEVCIFKDDVPSSYALFGDAAFVDLVHEIQLELTGADISLAAPLVFRTCIKKGPVYTNDLFRLYRYENLLYSMRLSGQEVKDILEYATIGWINNMQSEDDFILKYKTDSTGNPIASRYHNGYDIERQYYNFSSAEGINYTIDLQGPPGNRVSISSMSDGRPFMPEETYIVAMNSYRGNGGGGHLTKGAGIPPEELPGRLIGSSEKDLRFLMMKWLQEKGEYTPLTTNNWSMLPEDWRNKAAAKEHEMIFGSEYMNAE